MAKVKEWDTKKTGKHALRRDKTVNYSRLSVQKPTETDNPAKAPRLCPRKKVLKQVKRDRRLSKIAWLRLAGET